MGRTKLEAVDENSKVILAYIEGVASETLVQKINNGDKTMKGCMNFIKKQARGKAKNGCAMIQDIEVYGWAMHYFEEDDIKEGYVREPKLGDPQTGAPLKVGVERQIQQNKEEAKAKAEKEAAKSKDLPGQIDMFALMGGM